MRRRSVARYAAPVALLLAATIVVLLVRAGLHGSGPGGGGRTTTVPGGTARPASVPARTGPAPTAPEGLSYSVRSGDTLGGIANRFGTTVDELLARNPGIDPTALRVGQKLRVR